MPNINNGYGLPPGTQNASNAYDNAPKNVAQFLQRPVPTIQTFQQAGYPDLPIGMHMVAGMPFPKSAQVKLMTWNRSQTESQYKAVFNAPKNRMTQV